MKKFIALILIVTSLFTLSSSISCCAIQENSKAAEVETTKDVNTTNGKDEKIKKLKINKFLAEISSLLPPDKLIELENIRDCLNKLTSEELEIVLNLNFKNPAYTTLAAALGGPFYFDRFFERSLGNKLFDVACIVFFTIPGFGFLGSLCGGFLFGEWIGFLISASTVARGYNYKLLCSTLGK